MDSSSKLLDTVLMNRIIHQAIPDLDASVKKVIVYYIDITSEDEIRKFIAADDSTTVEIELRDLKTILDDVVIGDYAQFHCEEVHDDLFGGWAVTVDKFVSDRVLQKIFEFNEKARLNATVKKPFKPIEISEDSLELIEYLSLDCTADQGEWHSDSEIKIDKNGYVIRDGEKTKEFWDGTIRSGRKPLRLKVRNICGDETEYNLSE
jgi:adenine-specific DNA-methyltransferase